MTQANELRTFHTRKRLRPKEAAEYLGLTVDTLADYRCRRTVNIPYIKIGSNVLYDTDDLDRFLEAHRVDHGAAPAEVVEAG
jgi:excisionase family DNA binding protein